MGAAHAFRYESLGHVTPVAIATAKNNAESKLAAWRPANLVKIVAAPAAVARYITFRMGNTCREGMLGSSAEYFADEMYDMSSVRDAFSLVMKEASTWLHR